MYKIKIFTGTAAQPLETAINEWLQLNKDIHIHSSNLTGTNGEDLGANEYNFFILYSNSLTRSDELKEIAATVTQNQSVEVKEINPEIMKPSS